MYDYIPDLEQLESEPINDTRRIKGPFTLNILGASVRKKYNGCRIDSKYTGSRL